MSAQPKQPVAYDMMIIAELLRDIREELRLMNDKQIGQHLFWRFWWLTERKPGE